MKKFDLEAARRLRAEGNIAEALRLFLSALKENRSSVEIYIDLAVTYLVAFEDSGDPLCLDWARDVCLAGLKRDPTDAQRRRLLEIQNAIEDLLLESHKAEADAMADAMEDGAFSRGLPIDDSGLLDDADLAFEDESKNDPEDRGH